MTSYLSSIRQDRFASTSWEIQSRKIILRRLIHVESKIRVIIGLYIYNPIRLYIIGLYISRAIIGLYISKLQFYLNACICLGVWYSSFAFLCVYMEIFKLYLSYLTCNVNPLFIKRFQPCINMMVVNKNKHIRKKRAI